MEERRSTLTPVVVAALLLLVIVPASYIGAYYALVVPTEWMGE
jgi:hypothetical protein